MTKTESQKFHLKRCSCGVVARGAQAKRHFAKEGHTVAQSAIACSHCKVVASPDDLSSGAFRAAHQDCPIVRANSSKVAAFMDAISLAGVGKAPYQTSSTPAQAPARTSSEGDELQRAIQAILPSPIEAESEDDGVDLDRTPRATRMEVVLLDSASDEEEAQKDPMPSYAPRLPDVKLEAATATSTAASCMQANSQQVEMARLQAEVKELTSNLERLRQEAAVNKDQGRLADQRQEEVLKLQSFVDQLQREQVVTRDELHKEQAKSALLQERLEEVTKEKVAATSLARKAAIRLNRYRESSARCARSWLLHVPVRDNKLLYNHVSMGKISESFSCLEGIDNTLCHEVVLHVKSNGDIEYDPLKRKRPHIAGDESPSKRPRPS